MKKAVSLVGVGTMVLMLGLGSGFAQQSAPKDSTTAPAVTQVKPGAPTEVVKEKTVPAKPGMEVKTEKAASAAASAGKEADKTIGAKTVVDTKVDKAATAGKESEKAGAVKAAVDSKANKSAAVTKEAGKAVAPKSDLGVKPDKPAPLKGAADQTADKTTVAKPVADAKVDQTKPVADVKATTTDPVKSAVEKAPEKTGDVKTPVKQ